MTEKMPQEIEQAIEEYAETTKDWQDYFKRDVNKNPKQNSLVNCELIVENDENLAGLIGYNEFDGSIYLLKKSGTLNCKPGLFEDSMESTIRSYIEAVYSLLFTSDLLHSAIVNVAKNNVFNPVKDRIEKVRWDQTPRVENFFIDLLGADNNEYVKEVTKRWIVGTVARIYKPGVKFEIVPILEGRQGIGKSTAPRLLYTDEFFSDSLTNLGKDKDDYMQLQGNVVMEIAELASMKKTEVEKMKSFLSALYDNFRPPYAKYTVRWPRQCTFIGTTNDSQYLKDFTGERRFYPMPCYNKPTKDVFRTEEGYFFQVLAEAKALFKKGQQFYFDPVDDKEILEIAAEYRKEAKVENPIQESIEAYLEMEVPETWDLASNSLKGSYFRSYPHFDDSIPFNETFKPWARMIRIERVTTSEIMEAVFNKPVSDFLKGRTDSEAKKISLIVSNLEGWEKTRLNINGRRPHGYKNETNRKRNRIHIVS